MQKKILMMDLMVVYMNQQRQHLVEYLLLRQIYPYSYLRVLHMFKVTELKEYLRPVSYTHLRAHET